MGLMFNQFAAWLKSTYSEKDGSGSSSRLLTTFLALVSAGCLILIVGHMLKITDPVLLGVWMSSFPFLVGALIMFYNSPYGTNMGSGLLTNIWGKKPADPVTPPPAPLENPQGK